MQPRLHFALVLHQHQPVGNFDWVMEKATSQAYEPLIGALERHPHISMALHYTGSLLEWLDVHHPELLDRIRALVQREQVEILTGGFFEPILAVIPPDDQQGQIRRLTDWLAVRLGASPRGMWLAERVWEPGLPSVLARAGVEYTVLDDAHFKATGLHDGDLTGSFITEDQGYLVRLLSSSQQLRYLIPWASPAEVLDHLRYLADHSDGSLALMGDDGEKFGVWPGTYEHCWQNGWVEAFFTALEQQSEWLQLVRPGDWIRHHAPIGRVYLPTASYVEMGDWALPAPEAVAIEHVRHEMEAAGRYDVLPFIRAGYWRNFLVRYPESNFLHKRMLEVHARVAAMTGEHQPQALDLLWRSQANDPYWHGVFGGIYMPHLRQALYTALLSAERLADQESHGDAPWATVTSLDLDSDGYDEIRLESDQLGLVISPRRGGSLLEWDWRAGHHNLLDVMSRRHEAYHAKLLDGHARPATEPGVWTGNIHEVVLEKEPGLVNYLHYDEYRRASFLDRVLEPEVALADIVASRFSDRANFLQQSYECSTHTQDDGAIVATLTRQGHVSSQAGRHPLSIAKRFVVTPGRLDFTVDYEITNTGIEPVTLRFATEQNLGLWSGHDDSCYYTLEGLAGADRDLASTGQTADCTRVGVVIGWLGLHLSLSWDVPGLLLRYPVETVNNSEAGFERIYQASCLLICWDLSLQPGETARRQITFTVDES